ncbi:class I SAM-dependent methyltransferase [Alkalihalobacillus deserti]|uniref:class I SAM-dependent methyltransferase n=1 Tax=Alkalihalobacillus deserti TaxID=2879466 RepID=UPI001D15897D|nr:class I SAM-dependent methyltransferase [Alkalihalobacillus deserti]
MKRLFASYYDLMMDLLERKLINSWRKDLLQHAKGMVLEIGSGTGINFPIYRECIEVIAVEPNHYMIQRAERRRNLAQVPIKIIEKKAEAIPFPDEYFDTIVITLVLCSVDNQEQVLREMKRVLKPNGTILVLEHVQMEGAFYSKLQKWLTPFWSKICDGCQLNRKTQHSIEQADLRIISKKSYLKGFAISLVVTKR